jgi:hypothetical protein
MTTKQDLELFLFRVQEMRKAQKEYINSKNSTNMRESREKEALVDAAISVLRRKGYEPDQFNKSIKQNDLF